MANPLGPTKTDKTFEIPKFIAILRIVAIPDQNETLKKSDLKKRVIPNCNLSRLLDYDDLKKVLIRSEM